MCGRGVRNYAAGKREGAVITGTHSLSLSRHLSDEQPPQELRAKILKNVTRESATHEQVIRANSNFHLLSGGGEQ